jgi:hypothetical protein
MNRVEGPWPGRVVSRSGQQPPPCWFPSPGVALTAGPPLRWIPPQSLRPGDPAPARRRLLAWPDAYVPVPRVQVIQDGKAPEP